MAHTNNKDGKNKKSLSIKSRSKLIRKKRKQRPTEELKKRNKDAQTKCREKARALTINETEQNRSFE